MDLLPTWSDPVDSVLYSPADGAVEASAYEKQKWVRGRGQYTDLQQTATLDIWSVVYCTKGGVLRPSTNGQAAVYTVKGDITIDEKVHVVIADRTGRSATRSGKAAARQVENDEAEWYLPYLYINTADTYTENKIKINNLLYQTIGVDESLISTNRNLIADDQVSTLHLNQSPLRNFDKFVKHPYEFDGEYGNIFLPFVFKDAQGNNLSTQRKFQVLYIRPDYSTPVDQKDAFDIHLRQSLPDNYTNYAMRHVRVAKQAHENKKKDYSEKYKVYKKAADAASEYLRYHNRPDYNLDGYVLFKAETAEELRIMKAIYEYQQTEYQKLLDKAEDAKTKADATKVEYNALLDNYYFTLQELSEYKSSGQQDSAEKLEQYRDQCITAEKLAYMIYYGDQALVRYNQQNHNLIHQGNYGLWGQWYEVSNGWHRGIDVCPGSGSVHAVLSGVVSAKAYHYLAIYNSDARVTLTYMHLDRNEYEIGTAIEQWQVIGTQGSRSTGSAHTHLEVNPNRVTRDIYVRPWSDQDRDRDVNEDPRSDNTINRYQCSISQLVPGVNFPLSPYTYIETAWGMLSANADDDN